MLALFVLLQMARGWVLAALGPRWTTRIVVEPGLAPVVRGPYRFIRHPNYLIVAVEIVVVPLALGLSAFAVMFSLLNGAILCIRIRAENAALAWAAIGISPHPIASARAECTLANGRRSL
jgi:methyltransferase